MGEGEDKPWQFLNEISPQKSRNPWKMSRHTGWGTGHGNEGGLKSAQKVSHINNINNC